MLKGSGETQVLKLTGDQMAKRCEACKGRGFRLMNSDVHGLRIERCDACEKYSCDDIATVIVYNIAAAATDAVAAAAKKVRKSV